MNGQNKKKNTLNLKQHKAKFVLETSNNTSPASGQNTATNDTKTKTVFKLPKTKQAARTEKRNKATSSRT
jgi:hypothetical protein